MSEQYISAWLTGRNIQLYNALVLSKGRINVTDLIWVHKIKSVGAVCAFARKVPLPLLLIFFSLPEWRQSLIQPCCLVAFGSCYNTTTCAKCQQLSLVVNALFSLPVSRQQLYENSSLSCLMRSLSRTGFKFRCVTLM